MDFRPDQHARLRHLADRCLRAERRHHTLAPTDLVHETWLRLAADGGARVDAAALERTDPVIAARVMRRILIDHARRRNAAKRAAGRSDSIRDLDLVAPEELATRRDDYVVALDAALGELAQLDSELAAVVELRFFGGANVEETAAALSISPRTVKRRWQLAKAWLHREITK